MKLIEGIGMFALGGVAAILMLANEKTKTVEKYQPVKTDKRYCVDCTHYEKAPKLSTVCKECDDKSEFKSDAFKKYDIQKTMDDLMRMADFDGFAK